LGQLEGTSDSAIAYEEDTVDNNHVIVMPKFGARNRKATVRQWFKNLGDWVAIGDKLCIVETSKAVYEIWADKDGFLVRFVPVGTVLMPGETLAELISDAEYRIAPEMPLSRPPV
jgi:pyruvate/2-oxoglutarate dehydrogenase complex dihydrolipoamide acyltransferase (E2) component